MRPIERLLHRYPPEDIREAHANRVLIVANFMYLFVRLGADALKIRGDLVGAGDHDDE